MKAILNDLVNFFRSLGLLVLSMSFLLAYCIHHNPGLLERLLAPSEREDTAIDVFNILHVDNESAILADHCQLNGERRVTINLKNGAAHPLPSEVMYMDMGQLVTCKRDTYEINLTVDRLFERLTAQGAEHFRKTQSAIINLHYVERDWTQRVNNSKNKFPEYEYLLKMDNGHIISVSKKAYFNIKSALKKVHL